MEPVIIPIDGILDLHTFQPGEVKNLVKDYIEACLAEGVYSLRIITGKGKGIMKRKVATVLKRHPQVHCFENADPMSGGWGALIVELKKPHPP
jgi:DNA-nicking Smr family endonuclease